MARKKSTELTAESGSGDPQVPSVPASPRSRRRGRTAKTKAATAIKKTVVVLPAETVDLVRDVAERLERPVTWVINRVITSSVATLNALSGPDFLAAADAAGLR